MLALLQFDSASLPLLRRMLEDGRLPTLARLAREGAWETLDASATFLQSSTYMTLCTGMDVREHGVYSAVPWSAPAQRPRFMYALPHPPTVWERLTAAGRRSLIVDPILAWAPDRIAGVYLSGWQFEDRMVARGRALPRAVGAGLARRLGRGPRLDDVYGARSAGSLLEWRRHLVAAPDRAADAVVELLRREPFDLVWVNFGAAHKAGHHLWDPAAVADAPLDDTTEHRLRAGLAQVYEAVDRAMDRILAALPDRADVIVFSPTGMDANTSRADLLPGMLDAVLAGGTPRAKRARSRSPIWAIRSAVPTSWRDRAARLLPDDLVADLATRLYLRRDWSRTRAMAVPGENKGYIRVNLAGREREGIVRPGEVDELLETIAAGLRTFHDPDGEPSITCVERMTSMTSTGSAVSRLPDLVVHWGGYPAGRLSRVTSPVHGDVTRLGVGSGRSGNHVDDAWAVILPGPSRRRDPGRPARITDIAATACALLGADATGLGGAPLLEATA